MLPDNIACIDVGAIAAPDCALFLWATLPMLPEAFSVMESWGFKYKTAAFSWAKTTKHGKWHVGMGYWTRANVELCLLGVKGRPRRINKAVRQLVVSPVRKHSQKPDEVRDRIVTLLGDLPRIELFARERAPGWDAWGLEL